MRVLSINVGLPREVEWQGETVTTSIFKSPVAGRVRVERVNVAGDRQSDLAVHGGPDKAVYVYPSEHYAYWRQELDRTALAWGVFGENLTSEGLLEDAVHIGDRLQIGTAVFSVTQPRLPCAKLVIPFNRPDMPKRFLKSGRTGFYLKVCQEGEALAGDPVTVIARDAHAITVADIVALYAAKGANRELLRRASELPALPGQWREYFRRQVHGRERRR